MARILEIGINLVQEQVWFHRLDFVLLLFYKLFIRLKTPSIVRRIDEDKAIAQLISLDIMN